MRIIIRGWQIFVFRRKNMIYTSSSIPGKYFNFLSLYVLRITERLCFWAFHNMFWKIIDNMPSRDNGQFGGRKNDTNVHFMIYCTFPWFLGVISRCFLSLLRTFVDDVESHSITMRLWTERQNESRAGYRGETTLYIPLFGFFRPPSVLHASFLVYLVVYSFCTRQGRENNERKWRIKIWPVWEQFHSLLCSVCLLEWMPDWDWTGALKALTNV